MISHNRLVTKNKFSESDDIKLKNFVNEYGKDWNLISDKMFNKSARQCKDRYEKYLAPHLKSCPFTLDEDIQLLSLYKKLGCRWIKISEMMTGRSDVAIKARFKLLKRHGKNLQALKKEKTQEKKNQEREIAVVDNFIEQFENLFASSEDFFGSSIL